MNARPANRRLISRAALVLLALVALAILFVGTPTASADEPPSPLHAAPPDAPLRLRVSPGESGELVASWRAPYDDGGSPITEYRVQWKSGSRNYDDSASSPRQAVIADPTRLTYTIGGLRSGTEYTVRVIATNSVGDGPPSLEESATTHPEPGDEPDGSTGGYGQDGVYTWWDGDREMRVRIEPDEDPQRYGGGEGEPVFRSDSGGGVMTLPGGVLLVLDPSWTGSEVKRFFSRNGIKASRVTELGFAENAYFVETEPGFPSLQLANTLAGEEGVVISSPNWTTEVTTDDGDENEDPVEDPGDTIGTAIDLTLDTKVNATISSYEDLDYYRFQLVESTVIWIHASLSSFTVLDTDGEEVLPEGNDGGFHRGKSVRRLGAGVYYLKFSHRTPCSTDINCLGPYYVQVNAISDQGDTIESATLLNVSPGYDIADSWNPAYSTVGDLPSESDVDFFKVELDAATEVVIRVDAQLVLDWFGFHNTVSLAVFDEDGNPLHPPGVGMSWNGDRSYSLNAGTYYFRLARLIQDWTSDKMWYYHVWFYENLEYTKFIEDCTGIETPFGDPLSGCQTHLGSSETGDLGINVQDVWETNKGEGIYVAVVDREVDYDHEDLRDNINRTLSHDYIEEDQLVLRPTGHGTSVAGLIAARDNELGVRGVAPRATIVGYNYLENGTLLNRADALTRNMDLVAVSNASFGKTGTGHPRPVSQTYTMALETGVSQGFGGKGTFYVHSAGNSHSYTSHVNLREQKNFYAVTTVCSVESDGTRADYSETGYALWVCAPIAKVTTENWNRYSDDFGGTSSAAPLVSGVAALIRSAHPSLTWRDVKLILAASAQHNDPDNASWREGALEYNSVTERYFYNPEYGFGVIDAEAALDLAESWTNLPPMKSTGADSGEIDLTIPDLTEDGDSTTVTRELFLNSDVGFTEFVEVTIDFHHPAFRDLDIEIESPSGTFSKLTVPSEKNGLRRSELYSTFRFGSAAHLGEDPSGVWTLRVTDHFEELEITSRPAGWSLGKIEGWSIKAYGHGLGVAPPSILILPQDQDWHDVPESAAPSSPQDLVVIPGDGRLTVKWLPSDEEDSPPVTAYKVQWKRGAQGWDTPGDVFEGTVTHLANLVTGGGEYAVQVPALTNGVAYTVRVIAVTSTGDSRLGEIRRVIPGIPGVAAILQELCDRTEQVRDAVMARKSYIGDCSIVTNLHLETVRGLDLEDSGIEALLAEDFRGLSNLGWLALSANDLSELPEGVFDDLSSLERLTLSSNDLSALPEGVFNDLSSLEILTLYSNDLSALPEGVFDDLTNLKQLSLSGNDLSALPEGVFDDLTNLKQLSLSGNDLSEWPESVFNDLSSLEWLSLHGNDLSELPEGALDGLTNMERLFLYQNALSKLPEGVFDKLSNLRVLYLWGNDLSALPEGVFDDLTNLESLALGANDLSALPEGVFDDLSSLELLTLARNGLSALPEGVFDDLSSLESLTLDGNDLSGLPDDLFDGLSGIRQLELHDNPGAPFTFTAELSQVAAVAVVVELAQAVPFDMVVTLSAQGGLLSTSTVTVDAGTSRSKQIRVTPDDEGPVTLTLVSAAFQSSAPAGGLTAHNFQFEGIEAVLGQPLTLRDAKGDNTPATGLPTIVGITRTGETLTAHTSGIHDADGWLTGATFSYQWVSYNGTTDTDIRRATDAAYTLTTADQGKTIKVRVSFTDRGGYAESLTSAESQAVTNNDSASNTPATGLPTISGTARVGETLTVDTSGIDDADGMSGAVFSYQWLANDAEITGATGDTYTLVEADFDKAVKVRVIFNDDDDNEETLTSEPTAAVMAKPNSPATGAPTISGTVRVGEILTAHTSDIADPDGLNNVEYNFNWGAGDYLRVMGDYNTYRVQARDVGLTIKVWVGFTDEEGNLEILTSVDTVAVVATTPAAPQHLNVSHHGTGALDLSWEAPIADLIGEINGKGTHGDGGSAITGYKVQWKSGSEDYDGSAGSTRQAEITDPASRTHTITGLTDGVEYAVRVIAVNDVGDGPPSDEATGTPRETTPPELATATVDGATLTLTYDEDLDEASEPSSDAFSATVGGTGRAVDGVSVSGSSVILTLGSAVASGATVTVSYTVPTDAAAARIRDLAGNATASFTGHAVTNNTPKPNSPATGLPTITGTAQVGETLTADISGIGDDDGLPAESEFDYQWIAGTTDIAGATGSSYAPLVADLDKTIKVRVSFDDDRNFQETLTSEATATVIAAVTPLTAEFQDAPPSHNGSDTFTFRIAFSEPISISYKTLRDDSLDVTNGSATKAKRVDGQSDLWEITVEPDSNAAVTVVLPITEDCAAQDAVCTRDGTKLSNRSELTVPGPAAANSPATGAPIISGTARVGETLTVDTSGIDDADGMSGAVFSYQWLADGVDIAGATSDTYTPVADDVGKAVKVRVIFNDDDNNEETLTSEATAAVEPRPNTPASGLPTIDGTAQVGETLTVDTSGIDDADGIGNATFSYQWIAGTTDISGATGSTYTLVADDVGKAIRVRVSFDDDRNFLETLTSAATATVVTPLTAGFQDAPDKHLGTGVFTFEISFSEPISISYKTLRDDSLDVTNGSATKAKRLNGQSDLWEITVEPDSNAAVTVVLPITEDCESDGAVCTRDGTKLSNRSELTVPGPAAANSPATGAPIISGTARVGETLTVDTSGIEDADGMSGAVFSYQWLADGVEITGATSDTYTLVEADFNKAVKVRVIFNDDDNNEETLTSPATAAVAAETAVPDAPRSLNVSPDDTGTLDVSWEAPASDGGSAITGYKVQWKRVGDSWDTPADVFEETVSRMTHTITGLTDGVEYAVRVIAVNDVGDGPPSDEATGTPRETTPPELATATVDGRTLTLTYDEDLDENSEPSSDAFSVAVVGTGRAVDRVSVAGDTVTLTLASAVTAADTVTVSYTAPTDAAAPRIQDEAGNPAASFSDQDVENNTPPPANTPATGAPTISGTVRVGETLTAETSAIADADGLDNVGYSYQWLANGADIAGATSDTYTLVETDVGLTIKVKVSFRDDKNNPETLTSAAMAGVEPRPNSPATGAPTISGTVRVGETLTAETSAIADADGMSGAVFSYQWLANGADVAGATNDTYTPVADDVGKAIQVKVSFRDDRNHQESLTSAATAAVEAAADDSSIWSATLTVGSIAGFRGFWKDVGMGELTSEVFTLDGVDYTVKVLSDTNGLQFDLTLDKALPVGFTLQVGATTLSSQDASIREYSSGATQYGWANQGVILADVDTVEVSLTLAE